MTSAEESQEVPYHLMPLAALCGSFAVIGSIKAIHQVYKNLTYKSGIPPSPLSSKQFLSLISGIIVSILSYGKICATVNNSIASLNIFDPFEILNIASAANSTEVKAAYRQLSKLHHPDKGGDSATFQNINLAYKALTDSTSRQNWELYGHPDGKQSQTLSFALPDWLLHPTGNVALILVVMYLAMFVSIIYYLVKFLKTQEQKEKKMRMDNSVAQSDISYLATHLSPDSTHYDVLFYIATCPESIEVTEMAMKKGEELKQARLEYLGLSKKKDDSNDEFNFDDDGWADDDDENEDAAAAKAAKEEKEKLAKQVAAASGKDEIAKNIKIEGIDDGVLGQAWVESSLKKMGQWPPKFGNSCNIANMTFSLEGKGPVTALEHPAVRRNLCMTLGRLNAQALNSHPELIEAGKKTLIDPTYFRSTMEYRQRTGLLLEAALRVAGSARSYRLYKTIVECVAMFKIGTTSVSDEKTLAWFKDVMIKTYGGEEGIPRVNVSELNIETPDEDEIATEDTCKLSIDIERPHAEAFTKQKIAMAQKQGIPPQIALQTFREGWWILIRCEKLDGPAPVDNEHMAKNPILAALDNGSKSKFMAEIEGNRLVNAWPFIVSNITQKTGNVNVTFRAPSAPGKYKFYVDVKSQEFLGVDQTFSIEKEIIDKALLERKEEEEETAEGEEADEEPKKTK